MGDEETRELTAREKHDQGLELTNEDVAELERPPAPAAESAPAADTAADKPADDSTSSSSSSSSKR